MMRTSKAGKGVEESGDMKERKRKASEVSNSKTLVHRGKKHPIDGLPAPPHPREENEESDGSDYDRADDDGDDDEAGTSLGASPSSKREKRLAMNRASARERRRRKRVLMEKLEERVLELTKQVQTLQEVNDGLQGHVRNLEADLSRSKAIISTMANRRVGSGIGASGIGGLDTGGPSLQLSSVADQESRLRSLLTGGNSFYGTGAGALTDLLSERQLVLEMQAQQTRRNLLRQAQATAAASSAFVSSSDSGTPGGLNVGTQIRGGAGSGLLGRMNYLNAMSQNTLASRQRSGISYLDEGEAKADAALAFSRLGGVGITGTSHSELLFGSGSRLHSEEMKAAPKRRIEKSTSQSRSTKKRKS